MNPQSLARVVARVRALNRALKLALNLNIQLNFYRDLADAHAALAVDLGLVRALARSRSRDLVHAIAIAIAHARDLTGYRAGALISALERALDHAYELERILQAATAEEEAPSGAGSVPGRVSRGLVALAVRVLPARDRPRYTEEFRVELVELARSEGWGYALRTLSGAWELRRALTEAVRTVDGAPARPAGW